MGDDSTRTICATFDTREAADRAVEHLVQEHGIDRADVFVQAADTRNTSGSTPSGGDAAGNELEGSQFPAALHGRIQVSADVDAQQLDTAAEAFRSVGAEEVETR